MIIHIPSDDLPSNGLAFIELEGPDHLLSDPVPLLVVDDDVIAEELNEVLQRHMQSHR